MDTTKYDPKKNISDFETIYGRTRSRILAARDDGFRAYIESAAIDALNEANVNHRWVTDVLNAMQEFNPGDYSVYTPASTISLLVHLVMEAGISKFVSKQPWNDIMQRLSESDGPEEADATLADVMSGLPLNEGAVSDLKKLSKAFGKTNVVERSAILADGFSPDEPLSTMGSKPLASIVAQTSGNFVPIKDDGAETGFSVKVIGKGEIMNSLDVNQIRQKRDLPYCICLYFEMIAGNKGLAGLNTGLSYSNKPAKMRNNNPFVSDGANTYGMLGAKGYKALGDYKITAVLFKGLPADMTMEKAFSELTEAFIRCFSLFSELPR